jgi:pilus assembly protein Flp/PilA
MITRLIFEEEGQTLVEYALLLSLIAIAVVTVTSLFGDGIRNYYEHATGRLFTSTSGP